jgi:predicted metal-dependent phosphoesterase TrpH
MWTETYDLHSHSTHSDGEHPVEHVGQLMAGNGVQTWALTDHDTASGWLEASQVAKANGMTFIPGVEITCTPAHPPMDEELTKRERERASASWHLLAYFPNHVPGKTDESVASFLEWLAPKQDGREPRMRAMCARLETLGMPVDVEGVLARAEGSVGRPHLAAAMVEAGYVENKQEAFERWLGDGNPGFVPHEKPTIQEAVKAIKKAGGVTSLAHPIYYGVPVKRLIEVLRSQGINAVEAVHRSHSDEYRYELMTEATSQGLAITVGSDFHGTSYQQHPGHMPIMLDALIEQIKHA